MTYLLTDAYWRRVRAVLAAFGTFRNVEEATVEFVDAYDLSGVGAQGECVRLRVTRDWEETVLARGLTGIPRAFPVAAEPMDAGRPDVLLWRGRYLRFADLYRQAGPDEPWRPTGERLLQFYTGVPKEGFLARTPCGLGAACYATAAGAVIRAVRARGRARAASRRAAEASRDVRLDASAASYVLPPGGSPTSPEPFDGLDGFP